KMLRKKIKEGSSKKKEVNVDPNPDSNIDHERDGDNDRNNERKKVNYNKPENMYIPDRKRVLEWLTKEGVEFIVAPYEADAQLTYLTIKGKIDAVITEDSDLIAFGCPQVIYKLDVNTQMCKHYSFDRLKDHHLYGTFTKKMLLEMCIMIGCDYLPNLQGIGITKAGDAIKESKTFPNIILYRKNIKLRIEADKFETNKPKILEEFEKAIKAFTYQQVYDPDSHTCERLSHINYADLREDAAEILGPCLKDKSVHAIATGSRPSEIEETDIIKQKMDGVIIETKRRTNILISDFMPNYCRRHS
ncbi:exonuclease 1-like, partial [Rosa sericea]